MAIKTNKSYLKRLKVTKTGKLLVRKPGMNHFNAKERTPAKRIRKARQEFYMTNKEKSRFLVNL